MLTKNSVTGTTGRGRQPPPTPAPRLAAVKETALNRRREFEGSHGDRGPGRAEGLRRVHTDL